jgi:hypothetical protein
MAKRPSYEIPRPEPSKEFLQARNVAGVSLQEQFTKHAGRFPESRDFRWIKADLTWPSFDHLTFAYGNQIFSVLIEIIDGEQSFLSEQEVQRCFTVCVRNRLIPCIFQVGVRDMHALHKGWNLLALETSLPIDPSDLVTDERMEMSEWEMMNMSIQIVRQAITADGCNVLSFSDAPGIDPQVWFENEAGKRCWIVVRLYPKISDDLCEIEEFVGFEQQHKQLAPFDGYFAPVSFASSEPVLYDRDGSIVPLSRRFDGSAPLYRGDTFYIKFDGLKAIHTS